MKQDIYLFIPVERNETLKKGLERMEIESKEIYKKSNGLIDMRKTGQYTHTTWNLFKNISDQPTHIKNLNKEEEKWIHLASTGGIIWADQKEYNGYGLEFQSVIRQIITFW